MWVTTKDAFGPKSKSIAVSIEDSAAMTLNWGRCWAELLGKPRLGELQCLGKTWLGHVLSFQTWHGAPLKVLLWDAFEVSQGGNCDTGKAIAPQRLWGGERA